MIYINDFKISNLLMLASLSAPQARDSIVALRARSYILRIHISLFLVKKGNPIYLRLYQP